MDNTQVGSAIPAEKESHFGPDPRESNVLRRPSYSDVLQGNQKFSQAVKELAVTKKMVDTRKMDGTHQIPNNTDPTKLAVTKKMVDTRKKDGTHQIPNNTDPTKPELHKSQLLKKISEISVFHNVWIALLARYSLIKEKHPIVKEAMEFGENTAYWIGEKAEYVVSAMKMEESLKKLDSAALNGVLKIEDTHNNVRNRFHNANKMVRSRIEDTTDNLNRKWVRSSINAPAHTLLDFVENKFETVMLKRSSEKSTLFNDPGFVNTVMRLIDVTYRFSLGVLSVVEQKAREFTDKKNWENFYVARIQPHTPSKVLIRPSIIFHEILKELRRDAGAEDGDKGLSYKENEELLDLDKKVINLGRAAVSKVKAIQQYIQQLLSKA